MQNYLFGILSISTISTGRYEDAGTGFNILSCFVSHYLILPNQKQAESDLNGTFNIYASYFDNRSSLPEVDLLVMIENILPLPKMFCQIWFENRQQPVIVPVNETR